MSTFILAFILLALVMVGMSLGVMLMGKTIKGSCGGLNAISGADKCVVCQKDVDLDSCCATNCNANVPGRCWNRWNIRPEASFASLCERKWLTRSS